MMHIRVDSVYCSVWKDISITFR